jgi:hypothetical protein
MTARTEGAIAMTDGATSRPLFCSSVKEDILLYSLLGVAMLIRVRGGRWRYSDRTVV